MTPLRQSLLGSMAFGAVAFAAVSLGGFAPWAFAGGWAYKHIGEGGLYLLCAVAFIGLAGLLSPLLAPPRRVARFYKLFIPAFLAYAFLWSLCWFLFRFGMGEVLASLAGSAAFAFLVRRSLHSSAPICLALLIFFACHSAGYFAGAFVYASARKPPAAAKALTKAQISLAAKLLWGLCYGAGFGAGLGYLTYAFQKQPGPSGGVSAETSAPPPLSSE